MHRIRMHLQSQFGKLTNIYDMGQKVTLKGRQSRRFNFFGLTLNLVNVGN